MVVNAKENLSEVKSILVDAGYTGENFATQIKDTIGATVEVKRITQVCHIAKKMGCGTIFCLVGEKCRWLWKNCEQKLNTSLQICFHCFTPEKILNRFYRIIFG